MINKESCSLVILGTHNEGDSAGHLCCSSVVLAGAVHNTSTYFFINRHYYPPKSGAYLGPSYCSALGGPVSSFNVTEGQCFDFPALWRSAKFEWNNETNNYALCFKLENTKCEVDDGCDADYLDGCYVNGYQGVAYSITQYPAPIRPPPPPPKCLQRCTNFNSYCELCGPGMYCHYKNFNNEPRYHTVCSTIAGPNDICQQVFDHFTPVTYTIGRCVAGYRCIIEDNAPSFEYNYNRANCYLDARATVVYGDKQPGMPCSADNQCQFNGGPSECINSICKFEPDGNSCHNTSQCNSLTSYCNSSNICSQLYQGTVGQACIIAEDCQEGLICGTDSFACKQILNTTTYLQPCNTSSDCTQSNNEYCTCYADVNIMEQICVVDSVVPGYTLARQTLQACIIKNYCIQPNGNVDRNCTWTFCRVPQCFVYEAEDKIPVSKIGDLFEDCYRRVHLIAACKQATANVTLPPIDSIPSRPTEPPKPTVAPPATHPRYVLTMYYPKCFEKVYTSFSLAVGECSYAYHDLYDFHATLRFDPYTGNYSVCMYHLTRCLDFENPECYPFKLGCGYPDYQECICYNTTQPAATPTPTPTSTPAPSTSFAVVLLPSVLLFLSFLLSIVQH